MNLEEILKKTQKYISQNYSSSLFNMKEKDNNNQMLFNYIKKFLEDNNIRYEKMSLEELTNYIFKEMKTDSFLITYLTDKEVEEINILSYKDIEVRYNDGNVKRINEEFLSPQNEIDVLTRLLEQSKIIFNKTKPIAVGHIDNNKRITVYSNPIFDKEKGAGASIRIVNPKQLKEEDFIKCNELNKKMAKTLSILFKYGISMCISGSTGSGKTTFIDYLLSVVDKDKRIITIEEDTRELGGEITDENGHMINNIIHLVTKTSETKEQSINTIDLLKLSLTIDPDYIVMSEMKSEEAFQTIQAANTGHIVIASTHADSTKSTPFRILGLCKQQVNINDEILLSMIYKAFPIIIFIKKLKNNKRKIMEISECVRNENNTYDMKTLFRYNITKNVLKKDGTTQIYGDFKEYNKPSDEIKRKLLDNGATDKELGEIYD